MKQLYHRPLAAECAAGGGLMMACRIVGRGDAPVTGRRHVFQSSTSLPRAPRVAKCSHVGRSAQSPSADRRHVRGGDSRQTDLAAGAPGNGGAWERGCPTRRGPKVRGRNPREECGRDTRTREDAPFPGTRPRNKRREGEAASGTAPRPEGDPAPVVRRRQNRTRISRPPPYPLAPPSLAR